MPDPKKPKPADAGKSFLARVLEKFPAEQRASLTAQQLLENEEALQLVGEGVLSKEDYSRAIQEVQTQELKTKGWREELNTWWKDKSQQISALEAENARLKAGGRRQDPDEPDDDDDEEDDPQPSGKHKSRAPALPADLVRTGDLQAVVSKAQAEFTQLASYLTTLGGKHQIEFGEALDTDALIAHSRSTGMAIDKGGYDSFIREKVEDREQKRRAKELEDAEKRGYDKGVKAIHGGDAPPGPPTFKGTLSGLTRKDGTQGSPLQTAKSSAVDAAVSRYTSEVAKRSSA